MAVKTCGEKGLIFRYRDYCDVAMPYNISRVVTTMFNNWRFFVMRTSAMMLVCIFLISPVTLCLADENKDHVCFRVLDSNKDGMVTLQEFGEFYDDAEEKFSQADVDKDGELTHDEYHNILGHGSQT